ncbi:MAG: hypothetical protein IPH58_12725 [Sphingobacteriales bacterium]|nr:hypothetical protein [Sphingobacteriales bacterium]
MNQTISADTIRKERNKGHQIFQKIAAWPGRIFSTELNPLYHLGGITILMLVIACISGIYIFIFYNINPRHAWDSVEAISNNFLTAGYGPSIDIHLTFWSYLFCFIWYIHYLLPNSKG